MTDATAETQTCPFCYTELDARATVCGQCGAVKDLTPAWMSRLKFYGLSIGLVLVGVFLAFVDGKGINWWAVPFAVIGAHTDASGRAFRQHPLRCSGYPVTARRRH